MAEKKQKTSADLVNESVEFASRLKKSAENSALATFSNLIAEDVKLSLTESLEPFGTQPDHPSGYDMDGGQKRIEGSGESLEDKGDGPDIIEGDAPDEGGATMSTKKDAVKADNAMKSIAEMDDLNLDLPGGEGGEGEEDGKDMNMEGSEMSVESDDEDADDKKDIKEGDEKKDDEKEKFVKENKVLKQQLAKLKTENAKLQKGLSFVKARLEETALINQKMDAMSKIFSNFPAITPANKRKIAESINKATSFVQVKTIFDTVVPVLKEHYSKKPADQVSTRAKQIVESAKKNQDSMLNEGTKENYSRFQKLAGLDG